MMFLALVLAMVPVLLYKLRKRRKANQVGVVVAGASVIDSGVRSPWRTPTRKPPFRGF